MNKVTKTRNLRFTEYSVSHSSFKSPLLYIILANDSIITHTHTHTYYTIQFITLSSNATYTYMLLDNDSSVHKQLQSMAVNKD
jgi:hypothetical protein